MLATLIVSLLLVGHMLADIAVFSLGFVLGLTFKIKAVKHEYYVIKHKKHSIQYRIRNHLRFLRRYLPVRNITQ